MQAKALYNLLRYSWLADSSLAVEMWQVEDYRALPMDELFTRLEKLGISLDKERFLGYAEGTSTPEELVECLWIKEDDLTGFDQAYLLLFELWRRLLPDKESLSLFCDELDQRIALYDEGLLEDDLPLQEGIEELKDLLDENLDQGQDPHQVFQVIASYCAHDLENFLYDYAMAQIDAENEMYASELVEGFYPYVRDLVWFDFLRIALVFVSNPEEGELMLRRLLDQLQEQPDFDLLMEIADYLVHRGDLSLFTQVAGQAAAHMEKEGQFQELLAVVAAFYQCTDRDAEHRAFADLIAKREARDPETPLLQDDREVLLFKEHVKG